MLLSDLLKSAASGQARVPDSWRQGRTAYGGLTAALMLQAARARAPDTPLRSALINFTGPVTGDPALSAAPLRAGRNVTTVEAKAALEGACVGAGVFSFGQSRESSVVQDAPAPDAGTPDSYPDFMPPDYARFAPAFFSNFDVRLIEGDRPVSGSDRGYVRAWARHRDEAARAGELGLLCLADVLPPAAMPMLKSPGPVSSMSWLVNLLCAPETENGWFMVESELTAAREGYSSQAMRIWNTDGRMIADGMQSIVVFA